MHVSSDSETDRLKLTVSGDSGTGGNQKEFCLIPGIVDSLQSGILKTVGTDLGTRTDSAMFNIAK